ncbi:hypothetical protein ADK55_29690 [Streptomyces sp. WM4235]|uniref:hypothetical protein n=1 Tax=Streptomyces sp. WM4235 TaxID=1415551 RepID=UPI0006AF6F22|nr:hypothetical protein [Streptomyces sp. WM4235]KOU41150.1 hypothetical protein ADK55_29690 [Streptomyces sp. WM4235]
MFRTTRRVRRVAVTTLVASSFALGGAAFLAPTAGAAVPAASCTVTPGPTGSVVITGEGFTAPRKLNDGESTQPLNVDANGNFRETRFQKNVNYTVLAVNEDQNFIFVNCKVLAKPSPDSPTSKPNKPPQNSQADFRQGFKDGFGVGRPAALKSCDGRPQADKSQQHSDSYWKGWNQGVGAAFRQACKG